MNNDGTKFVNFDEYCKMCRHHDKPEDIEPCDECLIEPANQYSHKPVKWEEKK